jgi:ribosomal protein S18 acetylase RimI-like enzyme
MPVSCTFSYAAPHSSPDRLARVVERVTEVDDALVDAIARLLPQLSPTRPAFTHDDLAALVREQTLLVAREGTKIVGTLTLVLYRTTRVRARIEDIVVDEAVRGRGTGEALMREALRLAREAGAVIVELNSRPEREAANRLYRRLGFELQDTNSYRLVL